LFTEDLSRKDYEELEKESEKYSEDLEVNKVLVFKEIGNNLRLEFQVNRYVGKETGITYYSPEDREDLYTFTKETIDRNDNLVIWGMTPNVGLLGGGVNTKYQNEIREKFSTGNIQAYQFSQTT
jgi:hypothetical protein